MPFLRHLNPRSKDNEDGLEIAAPRSPRSLFHLSPRSPRSPHSPKSPKSPRSPNRSKSPRGWSRTEKNYDGLQQCEGCNNVETMMVNNVESRNNAEPMDTRPVILHDSYEELDSCAKVCQICRVFRQALVLEEVTFDGVARLERQEGKVVVNWQVTNMSGELPVDYLNVKISGQPHIRPGVISLNSHNTITHLALPTGGLDVAAIEQAKEWLDICLKKHIGHCDNLGWSSEKPRFLVEILSPSMIRLCEKREGEYVALSYCWGSVPCLSKMELQEVERGKTLLHNLEYRRKPFSVYELPRTVQDAIHMIHAMGIRFAWIDTLCVIQDWPEDVATMHKVYSNALFTLCSCATTRATAHLIDKREAWTQDTEPCRLGKQWLTTADMSLNELRLRSPLAGRAWTLQEERLSPRMLYVSSSRMYWSCARSQEMEMRSSHIQKKGPLQRPVYATPNQDSQMPPAQEFLLACASRYSDPSGKNDLHPYWSDIVKSYALRDMGYLPDRLTALSGLAAKYLSANKTDEYIAGLWANNLAEGLAWRVKRAITDERVNVELSSSWPSWSWAVLPLRTEIDTNSRSASSPAFKNLSRETGHQQSTPRDEMEQAIKRGEAVKEIRVTSRMRRLWMSDSQVTEWSSISRRVDDEERFSFAIRPEQDLHAVHPGSGRVLVYEDRKKEVVAQLDFDRDVQRVQSGQIEVWAFQLGSTTMMLVEENSTGKWRRVGAAWNVRNDFFATATPSTITLL